MWTGRQARERGLVDELGGLPRALAIAQQRAGIDKDTAVQVVVYPPRPSVFEALSSIGGAEGMRASEILRAEGEKQGAILQAEGRREAAFRDAEAREREAEAEAKATQMVSDAIAASGSQALNYFIAQKYTEAVSQFATSPNAKTILFPVEATQLIGTLGGVSALVKDALGDGGKQA